MVPVVTSVAANHGASVIRQFARRTDPRDLSVFTLAHHIVPHPK